MKRAEHLLNPFDRNFDSLEELADSISDTLGCPATIEDANHRLLAYSSHDTETDPARTATIISRRVPEHVISSLWESGAIPKLMDSDEPMRIAPIRQVGLGNRVAVAIRQHDEPIGYIWLLEIDRQLDAEGFRLLQAAAQAAKIKLLQLRMTKHKEIEERENLFWHLLTGHYQNDAHMHARAKALHLDLHASFQIVVFHFEADLDRAAKQQLRYLITTTQRVRAAFHVFSHNQMTAMITPLAEETFHRDCIEFVHTFCQHAKERYRLSPVTGAIGSMYDDFAAIRLSYQEALAVIKVKRQFPGELHHVCHYDDLGYYRYLPYICEQKQQHRYENRSLRKLRAYDAEHHSLLLETLRAFLFCNSNLKEAAEALHIHANTLTYRLKRIAEISGIDLTCMDQIVTLFLDLKAESLMQEANRTDTPDG